MTRPLRLVNDETPYSPNIALALVGGLLRPLAMVLDAWERWRCERGWHRATTCWGVLDEPYVYCERCGEPLEGGPG